MAVQVASVFALFSVKDEASGKLRDIDRNVQSTSDRIKGAGRNVTSFGVQAGAAIAPFVIGAKQGIDSARAFEKSMKDIEVRAGLTSREMAQVQEKAFQIGRDTAFSAGQAADSFIDLLTSGQSLSEAMVTIDSVMAGAAASGLDLGSVADIVTDSMAAFGLPVEDAIRVVDTLNAASQSSSATFPSMAQAIANVGGVAANFGLTFEETNAVLAIFHENGIKGAEAGTQLKSMLTNMVRPTAAVGKAWADLGTSFFFPGGKPKPIAIVMADIRNALEKMTPQKRIEILQALGGSFGQIGLSALVGEQNIGEMLGTMNDATDVFEVAESQLDTFDGAIQILQGSIDTLNIKAFTPFMNNVLRPFIGQVIDVVNNVADWAEQNPELTQTIITIGAVIATAIPVIIGLGVVISSIGTIVGAVGAAIALLSPPILLIGGLIAGAVVAWKTNFLGIRDALSPIIDSVVSKIGSIVTTVQNIVTEVGPHLGDLVTAFQEDGVNGVIEELRRISPTFDEIVTSVQTFIDNAKAKFVILVEAARTDGVQGFVDALFEMSPGLEKLWNDLKFRIEFIAFGIFIKIRDIAIGVKNEISRIVREMINNITLGIREAVRNLTSTIDDPGLASTIAGFFGTRPGKNLDLFTNGQFIDGEFVTNNRVAGLNADTAQHPLTVGKSGIPAGTPTRTIQPGDPGFGVAPPDTQVFIVGNTVVVPGFGNTTQQHVTAPPAPIPFDSAIQNAGQTVPNSPLVVVPKTLPTIRPVGSFNNAQEQVSLPSLQKNPFPIEPTIVATTEVQPGDTLSAIARRTGTSVASLVAVNNIQDPNLILAGQFLRIPSRDSGGPGFANEPVIINPSAGPELFIPRTDGEFIPNIDEIAGNRPIIQIDQLTIVANDAAGGAAAGEAFEGTIKDLLQASGF